MSRERVGMVAGIVIAVALLLPALGAAKKKPGYLKGPSQLELEEYTPRQVGTAQTFRAEGGLGSPRKACWTGRTVLIHQVMGGVDTVVASVKSGPPLGSEQEGFWEATWTTPPNAFSFYVEAPQRTIKKKHIKCGRDETDPTEFPG